MADDISVLGIAVESKGVKEGSAALDKLAVSGANAEKSTTKLTGESKKASYEISNLAKSALSAGAAFAAWTSIKGIAATMIEAQQAAQKLRNSLEFSSGSAAGAAKELQYLRDVTNKLGLDFTSASSAYAKFAAATRNTGVSAQQTKSVFEGIAAASAQLGLSADETQGALLALSQMASKGTVASEELRGQLGERLPGAFNIAAKAMGVTTAQLGKMLEQGQVLASDFLPKFGQALKENFEAPLSSLTQEINRFSSAWDLWKQELSDGANGSGFRWLTDGLNESAAAMRNLGDEAGVTQKLLVSIGGFLAGGTGNSVFNTQQAQTETIAKYGELRRQIQSLEDQERKYGSLPPITARRLGSLREEADETRKALFELSAQRGKESGFTKPDLAGEYAAQQAKQNATIKAYLADVSKAPKEAKIAAEVEKENKAFESAVSGLIETDNRYQEALKAHNQRLTEIQKDPKAASTQSGIANSTLSADLDRIKQESSAILGVYANSEKIAQQIRSAGLIGDNEYYESKAGFIRLNAQAQEDALQQEIARLEQENRSGKDRIENDRKIAEAKSQISKIQQDADTATLLNTMQANAEVQKMVSAYGNAQAAADAYIDSVKRQNAAMLEGIGMGVQYREQQAAINQIEEKFLTRKTTLDDDLRRNQITKETYDTYLKIAKDTYDKEVALYSESRDAILGKQSDWVTGATEALSNYSEESKNVAKQSENAFTNAFKGAEDALVEFVKTGKLDFSSLAQSIIADLARIQIKAAMSGVTEGIGNWLTYLITPSNADTVIPMQPGGGYHTGGIVGREPTFSRLIPSSAFNQAPRYHTGGIAGDEVPAILKPGEGVFTAGQMKAMGNMINGNSKASGLSLSPTYNISVDSRTDQAEVRGLIARGIRDGNAQLINDLQEAGAL